VMNLGGDNQVSLSEAIAAPAEVMRVEPKVVRQPVEAGDVRDTWADVSRAIEQMWHLQTTQLKAGFAEEPAWPVGKSEDVRERN